MNTTTPRKELTERESADARNGQPQQAPAMVPPIDVLEDDAGITLLADMPGASKETLSIDVDGDTLTLDAWFSLGESQGMQALYAEVRSPRYRRQFTLSRELDTSRIEATLKDGVLHLRLPKTEAARPRRIEVRAG